MRRRRGINQTGCMVSVQVTYNYTFLLPLHAGRDRHDAKHFENGDHAVSQSPTMPTQNDRQAVRTVNMEVPTLMVPHQVQRTGVRKGLLEDLALKILYLHGEMSLLELSERTCLSLGVIDEIFQFFRKEQLCEVKRMTAGSHVIIASAAGKQRAGELLALNQYIGPAPVSLADYSMRVSMQSVQQITLTPADVSRAFYQMVLDQQLLTRLGTALVSGTSMFLHGPSGTGKTSIAATIPAVYDDNVWIPHAVVVDNQIVSVFDPGVHQQNLEALSASGAESDRRWVLCKRPCVLAGGELVGGNAGLAVQSAEQVLYGAACR